jgi:hypothetical protein
MAGETRKARARGIGAAVAALGALLLLNLVTSASGPAPFPCDLWQGMGVEAKRAAVHEQLVAPSAEAERGCLERNLDRFVAATDGFCRETGGSTFGTPEVHAIALEAERRQACPQGPAQ